MDYKGQKLAEWIYYVITILFSIIAWIVGFVMNDFMTAVYGWAIGLGIALLLTIIDWPLFNSNPVHWLKDIPDRSVKKKKNK
jgi:signal peptidase complex subunit 1